MTRVAEVRKAIVAAVLVFASAVLSAWATTGQVTGSVWVGAAAAAVGSLQLAYLVPNAASNPLAKMVAERGQAATVQALREYADRLAAQERAGTERPTVLVGEVGVLDPGQVAARLSAGKHAAPTTDTGDPFAAPAARPE